MFPSSANDSALRHIDLMLSKHGKTALSVGLPAVHQDNSEYDRLPHAFDRDDMRKQADERIPKLNAAQRLVFDAVSSSIESRKGAVFMIDAPTGSGKTFTMCALSADLRASVKLVLALLQQASPLSFCLAASLPTPLSIFRLATTSSKVLRVTLSLKASVRKFSPRWILLFGTKFL